MESKAGLTKEISWKFLWGAVETGNNRWPRRKIGYLSCIQLEKKSSIGKFIVSGHKYLNGVLNRG